MSTNINLTTFDNCAVLYFDNGKTTVVDPHEDYYVQLADMGFVTISEAADPDAAEHQAGNPPKSFVDAMIKFWTALAEEIEEDMDDDDEYPPPQVNPL